MNITLKQMRLFLALTNTLSVTKASQKMHITQPTASMQLKEMNENIGFPLFEVISKKIHLTALGKEFEKTAREMIDRWEAFEQHTTTRGGFLLRKSRQHIVDIRVSK